MPFKNWLRRQTYRDDPIGDLARDYRADTNRPSSVETQEDLLLGLEMRGACPEALETAREAWSEYSAEIEGLEMEKVSDRRALRRKSILDRKTGGSRSIDNSSQATLIQAARKRDPLLTLELYCQNSACPSREIVLRVKDYDDALVARVKRAGMFCPVCCEQVKMHWVATSDQNINAREREARISVNVQMYVRDLQRGDQDRIVIVDAAKYTDDRLPPTPEGWFGAPPHQRRRFVRGDEQ